MADSAASHGLVINVRASVSVTLMLISRRYYKQLPVFCCLINTIVFVFICLQISTPSQVQQASECSPTVAVTPGQT